MPRSLVPSPSLRRALWVDAIASTASMLPMVLAAPTLASLTGLSAGLLWPVGLAMLPYVAYLLWLVTRPSVPAGAVWVPIVLNLLWALDCALLAAMVQPRPTALGLAFIGMQAAAVLLFAAWQFVALRRLVAQPA